MPTSLARPSVGESLYDRDFYQWTREQARALRRSRPADLDWENVSEEIESLGKSDKRSIEGNLNVLVMHLLKWRFQPQLRKAGWRATILEHRARIQRIIAD